MAYDTNQLIQAMRMAQASAQGGGTFPPQSAAAGAPGGGFVPPQKGGSQVPGPGHGGPLAPGPNCPYKWVKIGGQWMMMEACPQAKDCQLELRNLENEIESRYGRDAAKAYLPMLLERLWQCQQENNDVGLLDAFPERKPPQPRQPGPPVGQR